MSRVVRVWKTRRFIRRYLHLTPYWFADWKDAPDRLGVDVIVVGSDQVWRCGDGMDPRPFLLCDAPVIPAISYAASFGMAVLPDSMKDVYKQALRKFSAVSCREQEGVNICESLGISSKHVVDPTLLMQYYGERSDCAKKQGLLCYFISQDVDAVWPYLINFAKSMNCKIIILTNSLSIPVPISVSGVYKFLRRLVRQFNPSVKIKADAGPLEFAYEFSKAAWVVSDSFHALMFSIRNNANVRIVRPMDEVRKSMFSRIEEFSDHITGPVIANNVADALKSMAAGESIEYDYGWIERARVNSRHWLANAIARTEAK